MTRSILWQRSGGHYLFWSGAIYLTAGMYVVFIDRFVDPGYLAPIWIAVLTLPFLIPPFGRWLNMNIEWDRNMFNLFGRNKTTKDFVAEAKETYGIPEQKPMWTCPPEPEPKKEKSSQVFYRFGLTDDNRVAFSMGYSEITMNRQGCQQMIDQLTFFMDQLPEDEDVEETSDSNDSSTPKN